MISGHNFIGFEKKASGPKKLYAFSTVQKGNLTGEFCVATEREINEAISKATSALYAFMQSNPRCSRIMQSVSVMAGSSSTINSLHLSDATQICALRFTKQARQ